jgi:nitroreductase
MLDSFANLVRRARSHRRYAHAETVSREAVEKLIDLARLAPSGMNAQPLRYRIVTAAAQCEAVFQCTNWAKGLRTGPAPTPQERPAAWVLILSTQPAAFEPAIDVGIAAQTINLAAAAAGLATCMLANIDRTRLAEILKVPADLKVELLMSIGKPGETVVIEELRPGVATPYWRTPDQVHHVPKRSLEDVLV